jgi:hypothetical protein
MERFNHAAAILSDWQLGQMGFLPTPLNCSPQSLHRYSFPFTDRSGGISMSIGPPTVHTFEHLTTTSPQIYLRVSDPGKICIFSLCSENEIERDDRKEEEHARVFDAGTQCPFTHLPGNQA